MEKTNKKFNKNKSPFRVVENNNDDINGFLFAPKDWEEQAIPKVPEGDIFNRPEDAEAQ